jgi:hypothetical protein
MASVLAAAILLATSIRGPADVESLTALADAVVHARVASARSHPGTGGGLIFTEVSVVPIEWWKGSPTLQPISVRIDGGRIGDIGQSVAGAPAFTAGDEVVLFLRRIATGLYEVEHLALGKFAIKPGAGGALHAVRDRTQVACAGCTSAEADDLPVDELRERVRRAAGPAAR